MNDKDLLITQKFIDDDPIDDDEEDSDEQEFSALEKQVFKIFDVIDDGELDNDYDEDDSDDDYWDDELDFDREYVMLSDIYQEMKKQN